MNIKFIIMMSFNVNVFSPFVYIDEKMAKTLQRILLFFSLVLIYNQMPAHT